MMLTRSPAKPWHLSCQLGKQQEFNGQAPRIVQLSDLAGMRKAVEKDLGALFDSEVPAKSLLAAKLEQLEFRLKT